MDGLWASSEYVRSWSRRLTFALVAALVAVTVLSSGGFSAAENMHGAVYQWVRANPGQDVPVLVQTNGNSDTVADFVRSSGGTVQRQFDIIPAIEADVPSVFVRTLASHPDVARISLDAPVVASFDALENTGLVARYFFDEAASGQAPTHLLDAAHDPLNLPITYDGTSPTYKEIATGRGWGSTTTGNHGRASIPVDGTKIQTLLDGSNEATIELVLDIVEPANAWTTGLSHTAGSGSDRLLLFVVGYEDCTADTGVSSVSYGGQSLTSIVGGVAGTTCFDRVELWYLDEAGITAATGNTFSVTWGGTAPANPMYAAATYTGVNQTNPILDTSSNSTNTSTPNPITATVDVRDGAMAVSGVISGKDGSYTWGDGWTEVSDQTSGTTTTMSSAENIATADGTDTASATHSGPNRQVIVTAALNPLGAGVNSSCSRLTHVGASSEPGYLTLRACGISRIDFNMFGSALRGRWDPDFETSGRMVLHLVYDSTLPEAADRVKLYKDGALLTKTDGANPPQYETISIPSDKDFVIANRELCCRSFDGDIYYAAYYNEAFTPVQTTNNDAILQITDDAVAWSGPPLLDPANRATAYPGAVNAEDAWAEGYTGAGIGVAVIDTGISHHADFGTTSRVAADVGVNPAATSTDDGFGHGTHVAGIIGGLSSAGDYVGIAPAANLINVNIADDEGNASLGDAIAGLEFVYDNRETYNIRVANLSLHSSVAQSYKTDPLCAAAEFLWINGVFVVVAAGNSGDAPDAVHYCPSNDPFVMTTGAIDDKGTSSAEDDVQTAWSSFGVTQDGFTKPELLTPGTNIVSLAAPNTFLYHAYPERIVGGDYFRLSGTSMAAGVMSGLAALVLERHPDWTPGELKCTLIETARSAPRIPLTGAAFHAPVPSCDSDVGLAPSDLLLRAPSVVPSGVIAYVLGDPNRNAAAREVGLDLKAANIQTVTLDTVDWSAIRWGAIDWSAIRWGAIRWDAIRWDAIQWDAIQWEAIEWEAIRWSAIEWDAIRWSAIRWGAIRWGAIRWGALRWSTDVEFDAVRWSNINWDITLAD